MWKLKHISVKNIVSFRELELDIEQQVATLVFGQNLDNENQKANGSGKSSLIEAISFGITGDTLRKVKTEEIINDAADDASVILVFENDYDHTTFEVMRRIFRDTPQIIECHKFDADDNEIEVDKTVQPTVADYNRYILDEIGLSKDDIYANYILCRNKYKSFFDASDREKKEIINRFSNGVLVDESIARLLEDITPIEKELRDKEMDVARINGKIEAVNEQIAEANQKQEEAQRSREQQIESLHDKIASKREEIRVINKRISDADNRLDLIDEAGEQIEKLESSDTSFKECYEQISELFDKLQLGQLEDYAAQLRNLEEQLGKLESAIDSDNEILLTQKKRLEGVKKAYQEKYDEFKVFDTSVQENKDIIAGQIHVIEVEIEAIEAQIKDIQDKIHHNQREYDANDRKIRSLENLLHGVIVCPKCQHRFLLKSEVSVEEAERDIPALQQAMQELSQQNEGLTKNIDGGRSEISLREEKISSIKSKQRKSDIEWQRLNDECRALKREVDELENQMSAVAKSIDQRKLKIDQINGQIENMRKKMFDEVFNIIDSKMNAGEDFVKNCRENVAHLEAVIKQYQESIDELKNSRTGDIMDSLSESKSQYEKDLEKANAAKDLIQAKYDELKLQEAYFIEFKSHLANQKIDAIAAITNSFLERIGSDIRVELEGFKKLKSGKIRDKITIKILRDGVDCGSFAKFSGGEQCRVNLANMLALHELTNVSCEDGKGLDLLCVDEILDCSDEVGMASYCEAINQLHVTSMIVTQVPTIEGYNHKLIVTKMNGESTISK